MAGVQILVVEDNLMQSRLVSFLLEEAGHTVQTAASAEKALEVLQSFRPGLILMDLELPGKDGLALTRELRLNPFHFRTPIIALTAHTDPSDLASAREAGCNGNISNPIDTEAFARQVRNFLGGITGAETDIASDSGDLLTEARNNFLAEGLAQCGAILNQLKSDRSAAVAVLRRVLHRWAGVGETLGFPEICTQARMVEALLTSTSQEHDAEVVEAIETALRRFRAATRHESKLPLDLIGGLQDMRIGLIDFSEEAASRIRRAADNAHVQARIERLQNASIENQTGFGALIVNACALSAEAALERSAWSVPAVVIGSRSSLKLLSRLPLRAHDFIIAPWDAEEILLRVYRLIGLTAVAQLSGDALHRQRRRPRVLIADDDPDLVALVSETLGQFGMDTDIARSGQQALETVSRRRPDAVLLDVNMHDLDGFEVLKKLRDNLATQAIPVLLLTARSQESDIGRGFGSGADDYVVKPFRPSDLAERVTKMISARRQPS